MSKLMSEQSIELSKPSNELCQPSINSEPSTIEPSTIKVPSTRNVKLFNRNLFSALESLESSFDISEEDVSFDCKRKKLPINLKLIKENVVLKKKVSSLSQIPEIISDFNITTANASTQTVENLDQMLKIISQFKVEKEKYMHFYEQEKENNLELVKTLDKFKEKTEKLESGISNLHQKLENSLNSEEMHIQQSQELSHKCVQYSNQLINVNSRLNELTQELLGSRESLKDYTEALDLFKFKSGKLKDLIIQEREEKRLEIQKLEERLNETILLSQETHTPKLVPEDQFLVSKFEDKIELLKEEAEKEKRLRQSLNLEYEKTLIELDNIRKKYISDKKDLKRLQERLDINKTEILSYQTTIAEFQNSIVKKEQEQYLLDQKLKNLQGQIHAKDLIIKDQNKKHESIWVDLENYKAQVDSMSQRQITVVNLKRDLARKDDLLKTYKNKLELATKDLLEAKASSKESLRRSKSCNACCKKDPEIKHDLELESKYSQIVNVLAGILVKVQPSPHEWNNNTALRERMTCISTKYLGKDLDSLMKYPDYPSQLLDILSQNQFESDLHAFLKDVLSVT